MKKKKYIILTFVVLFVFTVALLNIANVKRSAGVSAISALTEHSTTVPIKSDHEKESSDVEESSKKLLVSGNNEISNMGREKLKGFFTVGNRWKEDNGDFMLKVSDIEYCLLTKKDSGEKYFIKVREEDSWWSLKHKSYKFICDFINVNNYDEFIVCDMLLYNKNGKIVLSNLETEGKCKKLFGGKKKIIFSKINS